MALTCVQPACQAAVFYVDSALPQSGDGTSWAAAFKTVQEGVDAAAPGDTVVLARGRYRENVRLRGEPLIVTSVNPDDGETVSATILDGGELDSVVAVPATPEPGCTLRGVTITGGKAFQGGGVRCEPGARVRIVNCLITGNSARESGGGVFGALTVFVMENSSVEYNSAPLHTGDSDNCGGGLHFLDSSVTVLGTSIRLNTAHSGGGMACEGGDLTIRRSEIALNVAQLSAALQCRFVEEAVLDGNWWSLNTAKYGACADWVGSRVRMTNNVLVGNEATVRGGAIFDAGVSSLIANNVIVYNSAREGGAIVAWHMSRPRLVNNIIWGNENSIYGDRSTYEMAYCCIDEDISGEGNVHLDPQFFGDFRLKPPSPCINAGSTAAALNVAASYADTAALISWAAGEDLGGNPRISGSAVDMGAYEYQEGPPTLSFLVQYSSDLLTWESVEVGPVWQWLDDIPDGLGKRFYRVGVLGAVPVLSPRSPRFR